jgi:hypothetical protein
MSQPEKRRPGRPEHVPTQKDRDTVSFAVAFGATEVQIAEHLGVSDVTLRKYYRKELDTGLFRLVNSLGRKGYQTAMGNGPHAAAWGMFLLKTRAGWREVLRQENTGADGGPMKTESRLIFSGVLADSDKKV